MTTPTERDVAAIAYALQNQDCMRIDLEGQCSTVKFDHDGIYSMCGGERVFISHVKRTDTGALRDYYYPQRSLFKRLVRGILHVYVNIDDAGVHAYVNSAIETMLKREAAMSDRTRVTWTQVTTIKGTFWVAHHAHLRLHDMLYGPDRVVGCTTCGYIVEPSAPFPAPRTCPECKSYYWLDTVRRQRDDRNIKDGRTSYARYKWAALPTKGRLDCTVHGPDLAYFTYRSAQERTTPLVSLLRKAAPQIERYGACVITCYMGGPKTEYGPLTQRVMHYLWKYRHMLPNFGIALHTAPELATNPRMGHHYVDSFVLTYSCPELARSMLLSKEDV